MRMRGCENEICKIIFVFRAYNKLYQLVQLPNSKRVKFLLVNIWHY